MARDHRLIVLVTLALLGSTAGTAHAHFHLIKPDSWLNEDALGGPQKGGPCGPGGYDDVSPVPASNKLTTYHAGDTVQVQWAVTVPHTGFFRVAVAKDRSELMDPNLMPDANCNFTTPIKNPPDLPVLADNIPTSTTTVDVKLPADLTCDKCTLQVIMWMTNHPQGCIYYHCADLQILPADAGQAGGAADAGVAGSGAAGAGGSSGAGAGGGNPGSSGGSGAMGGGSGAMGSGSGGAAAGLGVGVATGGVGGTGLAGSTGGFGAVSGSGGSSGPAAKRGGGCSAMPRGPSGAGSGALLLALLALSRRRRR
jgi:hypothetical protein